MKQRYQDTKFKMPSLKLISVISSILNEYIRDGYAITVRSLYYQLVARGHIPNTERSYKSITKLVSDARIAGLLDWDAIEDRMRAFKGRPNWESGAEILQSSARSYHQDMWARQSCRVFTIIEKDALSGVVSGTCWQYDVPMLAARGYPSSSVIRDWAKNVLIPAAEDGQEIIILHMGDHDPSGIDMSRDLEDRIALFGEGYFNASFERLALNMDQIEAQNPPPNPAKVTDSRFAEYQKEFGDESWELDALSPKFTNGLLADAIRKHIDQEEWEITEAQIAEVKKKLLAVAENF